jgi:hypothetical protein
VAVGEPEVSQAGFLAWASVVGLNARPLRLIEAPLDVLVVESASTPGEN